MALTVTDDQGSTHTVSRSVETVDPANQLPTAAFTHDAEDLDVAFDATTSSDPDGTIVTWEWNFGDSSTGTGQTASHSYAAAGPYTVSLTVTDNRGGTRTVSHEITVLAPNQLPDRFLRLDRERREAQLRRR